MTDLLELAARVEGLSPDDVEKRATLNSDILRAMGWTSEGWEAYRPDGARATRIYDYLGSLDDAMTLVPEGWHLALYSPGQADGEKWHATLAQRLPTLGFLSEIGVGARTAAPAITSCALRARAHGGGE